MSAQLIDGKAIALQLRQKVHADIQAVQAKHADFKPSLTIVQVGERPDSSTYVKMKLKAAEEAAIRCDLVKLPESVTQFELLAKIAALNADIAVDGILVQLPLPAHLDETKVTSSVAASKDVDGFGPHNVGELGKKGGNPTFLPCTPKGIMQLLEQSGVSVAGKNAVVVGRSDIVGRPVASLLTKANANVTLLHSQTSADSLQAYLASADIVVVAIGVPNFVQGSWLKKGAVVVDVGANFVDDSSKKSGSRMVGDVDFESALPVASLITPVPGGVGPMTVANLLDNVVIAAKAHYKKNNETPQFTNPLKLDLQTPVPSDFEISRAQQPKRINQVAEEAGILDSELEPFGFYKAKVSLDILKRLENKVNGKYVLVTGITPTPLGEGKSTTTVGLAQALGAHLGKNVFANVRQPSMGPTFGIKGGAAGGGYSQVIPMDEFNMHVTGDIHAISMANNLLAAAIDTRMFHENTQKDAALYKRLVPAKKGERKFPVAFLNRLKKLGIDKTNPNDLTEEEISRFVRLDIDPDTITWRRVVDCNDRFVRGITIGEAPTEKGMTRKTGFDISVASECMAILALCTSLSDMRERLGKMVVAASKAGEPITCEDIGCAGALTALLKDAIKPNIMQTLEGTPVFVHAGPFANISIGASSVLADKMALKLAGTSPDLTEEERKKQEGYVVTEAGFDFTMGGERFMNIKCRASGLAPDVIVIVATVRALKVHGGGPDVKAGAPLAAEYTQENVDLLREGCSNLGKHIANAKAYGLPVVVAINKMSSDSDKEHEVIREESLKYGAVDAIVSNHWEEGGQGAVDLANGVIEAANSIEKDFRFLYETAPSVEEKISTIAKEMYGAGEVEFLPEAQKKIDLYTKQGFGDLPICIAKTQYSLSHDAALKGVPTGFKFPIRDVRASIGAGYLYALAAEIQTIPGLPTHCGFMNVEVNEDGEIDGLF
ncbi:C-1-tetrahydrofolate synthase mitochondrial precursor [Metschnikowia bicuspidata var. bicuspidata NRRL YB-4993]|uniref:C-1-tetrahydrofolate synthase, cytoplasmic n=1 Tax=Metschnikowia bicuspidata var. bicuspidata NRRL YB-4993 TaxID=869754 RepID=A0A1A0HC95_9ASCO|nr:C-1-tetrahydrofolate synthase mitochondrial precursor [Metschnikowia bicuspidata var. bicuspidata NRRL YB-4993]OBA21523.1 C-1-tetrahydrofolate synthase mitochondrial precursor [Metschnikowia bicuspidata var. bicuspidata NRRL YB-4993]